MGICHSLCSRTSMLRQCQPALQSRYYGFFFNLASSQAHLSSHLTSHTSIRSLSLHFSIASVPAIVASTSECLEPQISMDLHRHFTDLFPLSAQSFLSWHIPSLLILICEHIEPNTCEPTITSCWNGSHHCFIPSDVISK